VAVRVLRVRCTTWDQVEAFYRRKLRRGRYLAMKVPFTPERNGDLTVGLELPSGMVLAVDGTVVTIGAVHDDGRTSIEIHLHGMTPEVLARLEALVADGREASQVRRLAEEERARVEREEEARAEADAAPSAVAVEPSAPPAVPPPAPPPAGAPVIEPAPSEGVAAERFLALEAELRRLRQLPAHEVLGVPWDGGPVEVRAAWVALGRRFHPDTVGRWGSAALSHVAEELTIHINRAYERMRAALVADGRAAAYGPALHEPRGWLIGFDDVVTGEPDVAELAAAAARDAAVPALAAPRTRGATGVRFAEVAEALTEEGLFGDLGLPAPPQHQPPVEGAAFERQARSRLGSGDHAAAKEVLAAALHVYPRNRSLRALYHVATALEALDAGQVMLATSQLEAALAHDEGCAEAASALDELRKGDGANPPSLRRLFQ
jgi:hypothetical protein